MRLDDAVADLRIYVEARRAQRAFVVLVGQNERDLRAGNQRQVLPSRLEVDAPGAACEWRRSERDDLGCHKASGIGCEGGPVAGTAYVVLDVVDLGVKIKNGATSEADASDEVPEATEPRDRDMNPSLQEVIGVTACAGIATAFDVEVQVENVSIGRSVVNDLNSG